MSSGLIERPDPYLIEVREDSVARLLGGELVGNVFNSPNQGVGLVDVRDQGRLEIDGASIRADGTRNIGISARDSASVIMRSGLVEMTTDAIASVFGDSTFEFFGGTLARRSNEASRSFEPCFRASGNAVITLGAGQLDFEILGGTSDGIFLSGSSLLRIGNDASLLSAGVSSVVNVNAGASLFVEGGELVGRSAPGQFNAPGNVTSLVSVGDSSLSSEAPVARLSGGTFRVVDRPDGSPSVPTVLSASSDGTAYVTGGEYSIEGGIRGRLFNASQGGRVFVSGGTYENLTGSPELARISGGLFQISGGDFRTTPSDLRPRTNLGNDGVVRFVVRRGSFTIDWVPYLIEEGQTIAFEEADLFATGQMGNITAPLRYGGFVDVDYRRNTPSDAGFRIVFRSPKLSCDDLDLNADGTVTEADLQEAVLRVAAGDFALNLDDDFRLTSFDVIEILKDYALGCP